MGYTIQRSYRPDKSPIYSSYCGLLTKEWAGSNFINRSRNPAVTIRNVAGSFQPLRDAVSYRGVVWVRRVGRRLKLWASVGLRSLGGLAILWTSTLRANPVGEQVVGGAATFNRPDAATLLVNQQTDRAVINWANFSVAQGELTRFIQPSSTSAALNRVVTLSPSLIEGALKANGQVWLSNPNGVMVGKGGIVNVGSFLATTHDIQTDDFMRGADVTLRGQSDASIINQGAIEAHNGDVFLVAKQVKNEGQLMARDGTVGMVSGTEVSLQSIGAGKYKVRVLADESGNGSSKAASDSAEIINQGVIEAANAALEATGSYLPLAIRNDGTIRATGTLANADGSVSLIGGKGDVVNRGVVEALRENLSGKKEGGEIRVAGRNVFTDPASIITASGEAKGGGIKIDAKDTIYASGKIEAKSSGDSGGKVVMTGDRIALLKAELNVSGATAGGEALVGGDLSGTNPEVRNASALFLSPDSVIYADATQDGNGGKVILWSNEYTGFYGNIFARGGAKGGDGGFVETSSAGNLQVDGQADVGSIRGKGGSWLLDPPDLYIGTTSGGIATGYYDSLATALTYNPTQQPPLVDFSQIPDAQNTQVKVDRILFALNNNQNVIIRVGGKTPASYTFVGSGVGNGTGDIVVAVPIIASLSSTGSLTLVNNYLYGGSAGYGNIRVNAQIVVGGSITMIAASDWGLYRGTPPANNPALSDGGKGGDVVINAPLFANGRITLTAGESLASATGGTGGDVLIHANIYAGGGVNITGGDADKAWNTYFNYTSQYPTPGQVFNWTLSTPYWVPQSNAAIGNPTKYNVPRGSGGVAGTVRIDDAISIYIGNGQSTIRAGTAGPNQSGGDLNIGATILALGSEVYLTLKSGNGKQSGNLTTSSTLGTSGTVVSSVDGISLPTPVVSSQLRELSFWVGHVLTVGLPAYAETISLRPYDVSQSTWIGQTDINGLSVFSTDQPSIANLFATTLKIGVLKDSIPLTAVTDIATGASYVIESLGTTSQANWNTIAGTTGVVYSVGDSFVAGLFERHRYCPPDSGGYRVGSSNSNHIQLEQRLLRWLPIRCGF